MRKIITYKDGEKLDGRTGKFVGSNVKTKPKTRLVDGNYTIIIEIKKSRK